MNKILKTILITIFSTGFVVTLGIAIFLQQKNISPIFIEREWRERFDKNY